MTDEIQAAPCCVCATTEGIIDANTRTPARVNVTPCGVPGIACYACYVAIILRLRAGLDPITNRRPTRKFDLPTVGEVMDRGWGYTAPDPQAVANWRCLPPGREKHRCYMASPEWAAIRKAIRARSGGNCERCHRASAREVHHLTYDRLYEERFDDLLHVCTPCHEFLSDLTDLDPAQTPAQPTPVPGRRPWPKVVMVEPTPDAVAVAEASRAAQLAALAGRFPKPATVASTEDLPAAAAAESKAKQHETLKPKWTYSVPELPRDDVAAAAVVRSAQLAALAERLPGAGGRSEIAEEFVETKE